MSSAARAIFQTAASPHPNRPSPPARYPHLAPVAGVGIHRPADAVAMGISVPLRSPRRSAALPPPPALPTVGRSAQAHRQNPPPALADQPPSPRSWPVDTLATAHQTSRHVSLATRPT